MKRLFIHNPFFRIIAPLFYGVFVYLLILLLNNAITDLSEIFSNQELYMCIGLSYLSLESMRLSVILTKKFNSTSNQILQIVILCITGLILSLLVVWLGVSIYFRLVAGFTVGFSELKIFLVIFGVTSLFYLLLYFSNEYLLKENTEKIDLENRLKEKVEADFNSFKNEINPDLLYESLEMLLLTLHKHVDKAEDQIDLLAGVYRYQLMSRNKELVTLEEECSALQGLCELLNHRNNNRIVLTLDFQDSAHHHVIPGSLLLGLETSVRNTLISDENPLKILLYPEGDDYVVMQHKLNDKLILHHDSLEAFVKLQRSYSFFSDQPFVQVKADQVNYIKFPLIKVSEEQMITLA